MASAPKRRKQVSTARCSTRDIAYSPLFALGVADVRAGAPPRFDLLDDKYWGYERGRQWACLAPVTMNPRSVMAIDYSGPQWIED
jgi:hypothetical protein